MYMEETDLELGHLRIPEACEMATELAEYIEGLEIEGWN